MWIIALIAALFAIFLTLLFGYGISILAYGAYNKLIPRKLKKNISEKSFVIIFTIVGILCAWALFSTPWNGV